jgi:hypothetical protein
MTTAISRDGAHPDGAHPAPARARVGVGALAFGLFGAPAAWSVQTLVNLPVASHGCFPRLDPLATPATAVRAVVLAVSVAAIVVGAAAAAVAWRTWARTREEQQEGSGRGAAHGPEAALLETGEGRTRFLALAGVLTSLTFLLVSVVHAATLLLVVPCAGG